jgi:DNA replication factor GINS
MMNGPEQMTFDDLSAVYRAEMKSQLLSEVRKDLYDSLKRLQESVRKEYETEFSKDPDSIMCEGLNERRKKLTITVQKIIGLRMEKIAKMALRAAMGAENVVDKLTPEEREYYDNIVAASKRLRGTTVKDGKRNVTQDILAGTDRTPVMNDVPDDAVIANEGEELIERPRKDTEPKEEMVVIRILEDIPRFAGPDRDYVLKKEDIIRMPTAFAGALIKHEKAALLDITP